MVGVGLRVNVELDWILFLFFVGLIQKVSGESSRHPTFNAELKNRVIHGEGCARVAKVSAIMNSDLNVAKGVDIITAIVNRDDAVRSMASDISRAKDNLKLWINSD